MIEFRFYLLPTNKQKLFMFAVHRMRNGSKIRMGPLSELNYEMTSKVTLLIFLCRKNDIRIHISSCFSANQNYIQPVDGDA